MIPDAKLREWEALAKTAMAADIWARTAVPALIARVRELEHALEVAAPLTIHMASDSKAAAIAYAALGRPVGVEKEPTDAE